MNKKILINAVIIFTFILSMVSIPVVADPPKLPSSFWGTVKLNGANVPAGTVISAWINDAKYASTTVIDSLGDSVYSIDIPADNPKTPEVEDVVDGSIIVFKIGLLEVTQTGSWHSGTFMQLNLDDSPLITGQNPLSTPEDTPLSITRSDLIVSDPDDDYPTAFTLTVLPVLPGTNYSVAGDVITPAENFHGDLTVPVKVNDGTADSNTFDLAVTVTSVNDTPLVADIPDQEIVEGETFATINLDDYVTDVDHEITDLTWISSGSTELNVSIIDRLATISTPDEYWNGSETITFKATDPLGGFDEDAATFTVTAVNEAPDVADIPDQSIEEGSSFATINLDDYVEDVDFLDTDITWSSSGNTELDVSIAGRVATITIPYADWNGSETITFRATAPDALYGEDDATFTVTSVNDAPVASDIPDQTIDEGSSFATIELDYYVSDVDNTVAEITWSYSGNTELGVSITDRVATITTPDENWNGSETITFTATDPSLLYGANTAAFTVTVVNDTPVVSDIPDQTIAEGASFATIALDDYITDVDNTVGEMTWSYSGNTELSVSIIERVATITVPNTNWNGSETIIFTANDPGLLYGEDAATFTVTAVNDAPVVSDIPDQTITEGASFATIILDDYVSDVDNTDAEINWSYSGITELTVSITDRAATITIPNADWNGSETITFTATDPGLLADENAATFTVTAVNDEPLVSDIPDQEIAEGASFTTINLGEFVSDVDNEDTEMLWTWSGSTDLTVTITDRVATITTLDEDWNGTETITFKATDPFGASDEDAATLTVTAVNDAPVVFDIPDQVVYRGNPFNEINLDKYVTDVDNGDEDINWSFSTPINLSVSIIDRVAAIQLLDSIWTGPETITFTATDPDGLFAGDAVSFEVSDFSPYDGEQLSSKRVTFDWLDDEDASQYRIQLSLKEDFSSPVLNITTTASTYSYAADLLNGKTYYWRIQAYVNGEWGSWYPPLKFYSMIPPQRPELVSPKSGSFLTYNDVEFSWSDVTNAHHYHFQVSTSSSFTTPFLDIQIDPGVSSFTAHDLPEGPYYWRVQAVNEVGVPGLWSVVWSFTVDMTPPAVPGLRSPAVDASTYDTTPALSVYAVPGAKKYRFKVVQGGNCDAEGVIPTSPDLLTTSWTVTPALPYSDDLYWCAQSIDAAGNESPWSESEARRLIVTFQSLPKADASTADTTPTFSWYAVPGALGYDLIIEPAAGEDNPATEGYVVSLGAVRSYTLPNIKALEPGGVYHWWLRAHTASGSQESPLRRLTIAPPAPVLTLPLNAKYVNTATPTLEWNGVSGAAYYEIWADTNTYFNTPNNHKWFTADAGTSYTPDETEALGETRYYWKVRAVNYDGTPGAFSSYRYFTVDLQPPLFPVPALSFPLHDTDVTGTPTFRWKTATGARYYELWIDEVGGNFLDPFYKKTGLTVLYHKPTVAMSGTYEWKVIATDLAGNPVESGPWTVTVNPLKPGTPVLVSPVSGYMVNDEKVDIVLTWKPVAYAAKYKIVADTSVYFNSVNKIEWETPNSEPISLIPDTFTLLEKRYYWKIQAVNSMDIAGAFSGYRYFTVDRTQPAPVLNLPLHAAVVTGTPTFSWKAAPGAKYYELVIDEVGGDFSDPLFYSRSKLTVLYHKPTVAMSGNYIWKVIATDLAGNSSESAPWTVTVNPLKPGTPVLVSPVSGYMVNDEKVDFELTWKTVPYAAKYKIVADTSVYFNSVNKIEWETPNSEPISLIPDDVTLLEARYYWKVQAVNSATPEGVTGAWSAYRYFTVDRTPPDYAPVLRSPGEGAYIYDTTPALSVIAVPGARWYCFQVARDDKFTDVVINPGCEVQSTSTGWSVPSDSPLEYGQYWWRAQAIDAAGNITGWSDPSRVFTVTFQRLPSPAFPTGDTTPTFSWYAVPGARGYLLEVAPQDKDDNTATAAYAVYLGAVTSHTIPNIRALDPGEYLWRLRAYTAAGVKESSWRELVILPPAPRLTSPVNYAVVPLKFSLAWEAVPGAESYEIQMDDRSYFTSPEIVDNTVGTETQKEITLTKVTKYYWRVRAKGCADAYGAWSAYRIITVTVTN